MAEPLYKLLLFAHYYCGCDTTSAIYNQGKLRILQVLKIKAAQDLVSLFGNAVASPKDIGDLG